KWATLTVRQRNESRLRNVDRVSARRQLREFVRAVGVGLRAAAAGDFGSVDQHACARHRPSGIGGGDTARPSCLGRWRRRDRRLLRRGVARGLLLSTLLCLSGGGERRNDCERATTEDNLLPAERQTGPPHD